MTLLDIARTRRATKAYDKNKKISEQDLNYILQVINTAPTSMGLEQWRILNIQKEEVREEIKEGLDASNIEKFLTASNILIFITKNKQWFLKKDNQELLSKIKRYIDSRNQSLKSNPTKEEEEEAINNFMSHIQTYDHGNNNKDYTEWSKRQAYIALGLGMLAAAEKNINSTPAEGFSKNLGRKLQDKSLIDDDEEVAVLLFLGYKDSKKIAFFGNKQLRTNLSEKVTTV